MDPSGKRWSAIFVHQEGRDNRGSYTYFHLRGRVVVVAENGCIRNCSWGTYDDATKPFEAFDNLLVNCQGDGWERERGVYGWDCEYRDVFDVDLRHAKAMVKTLEGIQRKTKQMDEEWGRPQTYGQYVLRIAKAIGAKEIAFQSKRCNATSYDDMDIQRRSLADGANHIDWWIQQWQEEGKEHEAAMA